MSLKPLEILLKVWYDILSKDIYVHALLRDIIKRRIIYE